MASVLRRVPLLVVLLLQPQLAAEISAQRVDASIATNIPSFSEDSLSARLDQGRIKGSPATKVWLIIVSDFQCPFCKEWHDNSFAKLEKDYVETGKVRLAYLTFPITGHQNARPAAQVALCSGVQGKFWVMHDVLFATQNLWASRTSVMPVLDSLAATYGVNIPALHACVASPAVDERIDADYRRGLAAGVRSTPTIFIGRQMLRGVLPTEDYQHAIDAALAASK